MLEALATALHLLRAEPLAEPARARVRYHRRVRRAPVPLPRIAPHDENVEQPEEPTEVEPPVIVLRVTETRASFISRWSPIEVTYFAERWRPIEAVPKGDKLVK